MDKQCKPKNSTKKPFVEFFERNNQRILIVLLLMFVVVGIVYSFHLGDGLRYADERDYYSIATHLVSDHNYSFDGKQLIVSRPPGYPLTLALFMLLNANIPCLKILNFLALCLCLYFVNRILGYQSSLFAASIGILLVACYPVFFYTAGTLYPQIIASLVLLAIVYLLMEHKYSTCKYFIVGLLSGYLLLLAPSFIFTVITVLLWIFFTLKKNRVRAVSVIIIATILIVLPWTIRNYVVYHSFVPVSSNSGLMLLYGFSENTTPNSGPGTDISKYTSQTDHMNDVERDNYLRAKAKEYILNNKAQSFKLYMLKTLNYFNYRNDLATKSEGSNAKDLIMLATYGPLLLIFFLRIALLRVYKLSNFEIFLILLYLSTAFFSAIFFTRIRYRLPYDFLLIIVVAMFIDKIISKRATPQLN